MKCFKNLFRKEPEKIIKPVRIENVCFICEKNDPPIENTNVWYEVAAPNGACYAEFHYHKECVIQIIHDSDESNKQRTKLIRAIQLVQQWRKNKKEDDEQMEELRRQLMESREFLEG